MARFKNVILCAANKFDVYKDGVFIRQLVVCDAGHFLSNMQDMMDLLENAGYTLKPVNDESYGQGFINGVGTYFNRREAYNIAYESGQPMNQAYALSGNELDSSCIRHLPMSVSWESLLDRTNKGER